MSETITLTDGSVLDIARYPLPDGVTDDGSVLTRAQLATAFSVSANTITDWINKGMPAISAGQNGVAYEFRLSHCWAWRQHRDEQLRAAKQRGDQLAAQASMAFRNLDDDQAEGERHLTADEIRKEAEADYHRNRAAEMRGDLIRADRVRTLIEDLLVTFGTAMDNLPDFAEMNFGLSAAQVAQMQDYCDQVRGEARRMLEDRVGSGGSVVAMSGPQSEMELG